MKQSTRFVDAAYVDVLLNKVFEESGGLAARVAPSSDEVLRTYLSAMPGFGPEVWLAIVAQRQACLNKLTDAAINLMATRRATGMSDVRFLIEIEYISRLIARDGP